MSAATAERRAIIQKIRLTKAERQEWREAAKRQRVTVSQLVRAAVRAYRPRG